MQPPKDYKELQKLTGCVAALSRFIAKSGEKNLPFFKCLRRMSKEKFTWDEDCRGAFEGLKQYLGSPQLLSRPEPGEPLQLYITISDVAVSGVLVKEIGQRQRPIYYVSHVLRDAEERYAIIDKAAFAAQALADFVIECTARDLTVPAEISSADEEGTPPCWTLFVDGARNEQGVGAGVIIVGPQKEALEYSLRFSFPATNNEAEYEAMILGLRLARSMRLEELMVKGDSKLVIDQLRGTCRVKSEVLRKYHARAMQITREFKRIWFKHIPRAENEKADHLSRLATTYYDELPIGVCVEVCDQPAYLEKNISQVEGGIKEDWRTPLISYLNEGILPEDKIESWRIQNRSLKYQMYLGELYRKSWDGPLLTCVAAEDIPRVLAEVHEGWCGSHVGARSLAIKVSRAGYYWPTLMKDAAMYVLRILVSDNGTQFEGKVLTDFCEKFGIEHRFAPVYYPQSNGQVEVMNRIIFKGVKKNIIQSGLGEGSWIEELPTVLWSLRSTPSYATGETPFGLVYGTEAVLPVEVGLPTYRQIGFDEGMNDQRLREQLDFIEERRDQALYKNLQYKQLMARTYNRRVKNRQFRVGDLVLRLLSASQPKEQGKLSPKWEGPYRVKRVVGASTYELEDLDGKIIPRTWHASKMCRYYV
ncbi:hypothetical protein LIER_32893 [Lithospermum erythrorhizon]|uniref:Uncharacterized protein n=1 Tax=Lithospermum erythrorhizon TaxID=34254 RepID=A0AAV3RXM9_LITER